MCLERAQQVGILWLINFEVFHLWQLSCFFSAMAIFLYPLLLSSFVFCICCMFAETWNRVKMRRSLKEGKWFSHFDLIFYFSSLLSFVFFFILCIQAPFRREKSAKRRNDESQQFSIYHTNWITLRYNTLGLVSLIYMRSFHHEIRISRKRDWVFFSRIRSQFKQNLLFISISHTNGILHIEMLNQLFFWLPFFYGS